MDQKDMPALTEQKSSWLQALIGIPKDIAQPFSLSAVALVSAVILGIFGPLLASLSCIGIAVVLLAVGLWRRPDSQANRIVDDDSYRSVSGLNTSDAMENAVVDPHGAEDLSPMEILCFLHLYVRAGGFIGRTRIFPVDYFVDLMTAALTPDHLSVMVRELSAHLRRCGATRSVTTIASPKRGNSLLLASVARELHLQPVFVKERPLFGKMLEGLGGHPKNVAIVDDISSDGELLVHCVKVLREHGYQVTQAFVLIDRKEGDAIDELSQIGVTLLPMMRLGDGELEQIVDRGRRSLLPQRRS